MYAFTTPCKPWPVELFHCGANGVMVVPLLEWPTPARVQWFLRIADLIDEMILKLEQIAAGTYAHPSAISAVCPNMTGAITALRALNVYARGV